MIGASEEAHEATRCVAGNKLHTELLQQSVEALAEAMVVRIQVVQKHLCRPHDVALEDCSNS